ncbi:hypothetical protein P154DRAFT_522540 [Amniculicola lignicola CBS 123094]|uniref:MPN domain-containing protein n=1 Tax=Amniculicola lignicola CBS 123094 TaxID=1392246 RepID=A0A6A5WS01_9PLEO|nr:hypothetical protein P154DRAFT_522540 [Amniculicola lignicola CBS 123094]
MASINAPLSLQEITEQAANFGYNAHIPLKMWLRSADNMLREAQVYEQEGNDPQTYLLLFRHAELVLDRLAKHPERNLPENKLPLKVARQAVIHNLAKLETIKPRIDRRHAEYVERRRTLRDALETLEAQGQHAATLPQELDGLAVDRHRSTYDRPTLNAEENRSLAAKLAQREVKRRDAARRNVRQAGVSEEEEQERRTAGMWEDWEKGLHRESSEEDTDVSRQLQDVARLQNGHQTPSYSARRSSQSARPATDRPQRPTSVQAPSTYRYPSVPHQSVQEQWTGPDTLRSLQGPMPVRPPKEPFHRPSESSSWPPPPLPPIPPKIPTPTPEFENPRPPPIPPKYADLPAPPPIPGKYFDPTSTSSTRPSSPGGDAEAAYNFSPHAYLENGDALRPVFLPNQLRSAFLASASSNTRLNLETCGILCGILKANALFITRLVIPEQTSTSDTCETVNEQELFDYCDKEELMVLGWIHTHPSQTCFMSSRDLHTHVGYQVMMPESIAIVCAPSKDPSWGVFRLTDPPGKQAILNCRQPGIFHLHDVDNVYTDAIKPGHVVELPNAPLDVIDMRPKRR